MTNEYDVPDFRTGKFVIVWRGIEYYADFSRPSKVRCKCWMWNLGTISFVYLGDHCLGRAIKEKEYDTKYKKALKKQRKRITIKKNKISTLDHQKWWHC